MATTKKAGWEKEAKRATPAKPASKATDAKLKEKAAAAGKVAAQVATDEKPYEFPKDFKPPKTLAAAADAYYLKRQERLDKEKEAAKLQEQETALKHWLLQELPKQEASTTGGKVARVSVVVKDIPRVEDWSAFYASIVADYNAHAKKKDGMQDSAFSLLNRAVSASTVKELWKEGVVVKGIGVFHKADLSVNKV